MDTKFAIEMLEELGSSEDEIEIRGDFRKLWEGHESLLGELPRTPSELDVNLQNDAAKIYLRAYVKSGERTAWKTVTLVGLIRDRILRSGHGMCYERRMLASMEAGEWQGWKCDRCGALLLGSED